jgi:uncharacterized protein (TIGR00725 family)
MNYAICVSGAASGETVEASCDLAYHLGEEIARAGHIITTGATVGLPMYSAKGAFDAGGRSIGFSPAASLREHIYKYRLPIGFFDFVNFTGMHYIGRDIHLVQSSDAIITIGGRFGSLHEFTTAIEARMPCGVLLGSGGLADMIPDLMEQIEAPKGSIVIYDNDPARLVKKIIDILDQENKDINTKAVEREWFTKASVCNPDIHKINQQNRAG